MIPRDIEPEHETASVDLCHCSFCYLICGLRRLRSHTHANSPTDSSSHRFSADSNLYSCAHGDSSTYFDSDPDPHTHGNSDIHA